MSISFLKRHISILLRVPHSYRAVWTRVDGHSSLESRSSSSWTRVWHEIYEKFRMATNPARITVCLQKTESGTYEPGHFTQCIVDHIAPNSTDGTTYVTAELRNNQLHIGPAHSQHGVKVKHPSFCPAHHLTKDDVGSLPEDTMTRGIDCGAAVILESHDGKVLLTRRGDHLRTFPGIWVPPGGHLEQNETLTEAGLRELREETGLDITSDMCCDGNVTLLAIWESVFPPKLCLGLPKRHHAVIYLHARLKEVNADDLVSKVKLDPGEVGACAWLDRTKVKAIVSVKEGENQDAKTGMETAHNMAQENIEALVINADKDQVQCMIPFCDLLKMAGDKTDQKGRVSTGTKFALEEWLALETGSH